MDKHTFPKMLKSTIACLLVVLMSFSFLPTVVLAAVSSGAGTSDDPYVIEITGDSIDGATLYEKLIDNQMNPSTYSYKAFGKTYTGETGFYVGEDRISTNALFASNKDKEFSCGKYEISSVSTSGTLRLSYSKSDVIGYISIEKVKTVPFDVNTENAIIKWNFYYPLSGTDNKGMTISDRAFEQLCEINEQYYDSSVGVKLQVYKSGILGFGGDWKDYTDSTMTSMKAGEKGIFRFAYGDKNYPSDSGFTATLVDTDTRPTVDLSTLPALGVMDYVDKPEETALEDDVKAALIAAGAREDITVDTGSLAYALFGFNSLSVDEGATKDVDFTVSVADTADYKGASTTITVTIRNITDANNNGEHDPEEAMHIITWMNGDTLLETDYALNSNGVYTQALSYDGETPTKESDIYYIYTFAGWDIDGDGAIDDLSGVIVDGDITLYAVYTTEKNSNCFVEVVDDSAMGSVKLNGEAYEGQVYVKEGEVTVEVTPASGIAVTDITVTYTYIDGEDATVYDLDLTSLDYADTVATATFTADGEDGGKYYTVTVSYDDVLKIKDPMVVEYAYLEGDTENYLTAEDVFGQLIESPEIKEGDSVTVEYLAREEAKYEIAYADLGIDLEELLSSVVASAVEKLLGETISVTLSEQWFAPDAVVTDEGTDEFASAVVERIKSTTFSNVSTLLTDIQNLANTKLMNYGAHEFGAGGDGSTETVRISYSNGKDLAVSGVVLENVTIKDNRLVTTITGNESGEVYYGFTVADLCEALEITLTNENGDVLDNSLLTLVGNTLNASEEAQEVTVHYAGDRENRPVSATFSVIVNKAPCTVSYNSGTITYGDEFKFDLTVEPEGVECVEFLIGIDASQITTDSYIPAAFIQVRLPESYMQILDWLNIESEMKLSELTSVLESIVNISDSLGGLISGLGDIDIESIQTVIDTLNSVLEQVSFLDDTKIIISNDDFAPTDIGLYIAGAVSIDSNYETSFGVGYVAIVPKTTEAELEFRFSDDNGVITKALITNEAYNLGADAYVDGEYSPEATEGVKHVFASVDTEGNFELIYAVGNDNIDRDRLSQVGAYAQVSFILDVANEMYYAMPIARAYVVTPELVTVELSGEETVVYDGAAHGLDAVAKDYNGDVIDDDKLTVTYVGYSLKNPTEIYSSTEAPVNAGVYMVVASYADEEREAYGADAATLTISAAEVSVEVADQSVIAGSDYDLGITTTPTDCETINIVAGIDIKADMSEEQPTLIKGVVHIDFPAAIDELLIDAVPQAYTAEGITLDDLVSDEDWAAVESAIASIGISDEAVSTIMSLLEYADANISFLAAETPEDIGAYLIGAIACDANYSFAYDFGYLVVQPDAQEVELAFNYVDENNIITANYIKNGAIDMGAHVVDNEDANNYLNTWYFGVDANGELYVSDVPGTAHGAYTQVAFLVDAGNTIYYAEPIVRAYVVVPETVSVELIGEETVEYDGEAKAYDVEVKQGSTVLADTVPLTVRYVGTDMFGNEYDSTEAPVNPGYYIVYATYIDEEADLYGMAVKPLTIIMGEHEHKFNGDIKNTADGEHQYKCTLFLSDGTICEEYGAPEACSGGEATCTDKAVCELCGTQYGNANGHTEGEAVVENSVNATCTAEGSYDNVVYCTECDEELSRETITVDKLAHTEGEVVVENSVNATCTAEGSYDSAVYCTECNEELSRETITVDKLAHTEGEAVVENSIGATCTAEGSYDSVVYCTECDEELSRETITVDKLAHTEGEAVVENSVNATCKAEGSYDSVVYCTECDEELSRETITVDKLAHTEVIDAAVAPKCEETGLTEGSHCEVCGEVIIALDIVPATGHLNTEIRGAYDATYDMDGYTGDTYCVDCGKLLSVGEFTAKLERPTTPDDGNDDSDNGDNGGSGFYSSCWRIIFMLLDLLKKLLGFVLD